jgi:hypothetical protein
MLRTPELVLQIRDHAAEAGHLLAEYAAAAAHRGAGIHRDPDAVLRDLRAELSHLRRAADDAREAEEERRPQ